MGHHKDFEDVELSTVKVVTLEDAGNKELLEKRERGLEAVEEGDDKAVGKYLDEEEEEEPIQWNKVRGWSPLQGVTSSYLRLIDFVYHSTLWLRVIKKKKVSGGGQQRRLFLLCSLPNLRKTTSQKCESVPRRTRI